MADRDAIELARIEPERNCWRYYRMDLSADLFGGIALAREWGRIGTAGRGQLDLFPDRAAAVAALAGIARSKRRRGYSDRR